MRIVYILSNGLFAVGADLVLDSDSGHMRGRTYADALRHGKGMIMPVNACNGAVNVNGTIGGNLAFMDGCKGRAVERLGKKKNGFHGWGALAIAI